METSGEVVIFFIGGSKQQSMDHIQPLSDFINEVSLEHSHTYSSRYDRGELSHHNGEAE